MKGDGGEGRGACLVNEEEYMEDPVFVVRKWMIKVDF
jgi:hypothetical protein